MTNGRLPCSNSNLRERKFSATRLPTSAGEVPTGQLEKDSDCFGWAVAQPVSNNERKPDVTWNLKSFINDWQVCCLKTSSDRFARYFSGVTLTSIGAAKPCANSSTYFFHASAEVI